MDTLTLIAPYGITVLLGAACSVIAAFLGALLDARLDAGWKAAWRYVPGLLAGVMATMLPATVPGVSIQTRWIYGILSIVVWYKIYPYLDKLAEKNLEAKTGVKLTPEKAKDEPAT